MSQGHSHGRRSAGYSPKQLRNAQAKQWRAVNDSGLRSMLELEVCARARLLVTCNEALVNESLAAGNQPRCAKCAKPRSGFTERVVALHKARGEGNRTAW